MRLSASQIESIRDILIEFIEGIAGDEELPVIMSRCIVSIEVALEDEDQTDGERVH